MRTAAALVLLLNLCALAACKTAPGAAQGHPPPPIAAAPASGTVIYLVRRKWHIDVGFAAADLLSPLKNLAGQFPRARYVFFGFGDRHYLLARNRGTSTLAGALWPGPGLILMTAIEGTPQAAFGTAQVIEFTVASRDARAAQSFIGSSIDGGADERSSPYAPGPYDGSVYLNAAPLYSATHTCNTWAAEALRAGSLPLRSRGVVFAGQLWSAALKLSAAREAMGILAPVSPPP